MLGFPIDRDTEDLDSPLSCLTERRLRIFQRVIVLVLIVQWSSVAQQHEDTVLGFPRQQLRGRVTNSRAVAILMARNQATQPMSRRCTKAIVKIFNREKLNPSSSLARVGIESVLIADGIQCFTKQYEAFLFNIDHPPTGSKISACRPTDIDEKGRRHVALSLFSPNVQPIVAFHACPLFHCSPDNGIQIHLFPVLLPRDATEGWWAQAFKKPAQ